MDIISFMIVIWALKVLAEDGYAQVKGQTNPRIDRRRARQRSRANNPVWTQFIGWLGDLAEDGRQEQARKRRERRERKARQHEQAEPVPVPVIDDRGHPGYNQDPADPSVVDMDTPPPRKPEVDLPLDEPKEDEQPETSEPEVTSPASDPLPNNVIPFARPQKFNPKEYDMSTQVNGEVTGLDPAISYAKSLVLFAGEHGQAGNEGYIGFLQGSKVQGAALATGQEMQAAFTAAAEAADRHRKELEKQKTVQEAYKTNPDAGDKQFQQNGQ